MTTVRRLRAVGAAVAIAGAITCSHVWGDATGGNAKPRPGRADLAAVISEVKLGAADKFARQSVVSYRTQAGETLLGAQIKPAIPAGEARPRDLVVVIDTSASQAGPP